MILRPYHPAPFPGSVPAWNAVEATQRSPGDVFSMITQPEHAVLAGDLAARFTEPPYPVAPEDVLRAIAWHDKGWAEFDLVFTALAPAAQRSDTRPRSFIAMDVAEFLVAWTRSIEQCEAVSPTAGWMVSAHFARLAEYRLHAASDSREDTARIHGFLDSERRREQTLAHNSLHSRAELDIFLALLQFCDLLSLYLCCGTSAEVQFPQKFAGREVRLRRENGAYVLLPSPFAAGADLGVNAWKYPAAAAPQPVGFLLR